MKKTLLIVIFSIAFNLSVFSALNPLNEILIGEDENLKIELHFDSGVKITNTDWIRVHIFNKTNSEIVFTQSDCSLFCLGIESPPDGFKAFSQKARLSYYLDFQNFSIKPFGEFKSSKYLSKKSSTQLERFYSQKSKMKFEFSIDFKYQLLGETKSIESKSKAFLVEWEPSISLPKTELITCLRNSIGETQNWRFNSDLISILIRKPGLIEEITHNELVKGVLIRGDTNFGESTFLLFELMKRGGTKDPELLSYLSEKIKKKENNAISLMKYFWDDSLLDVLLNAGYIDWKVIEVLELNSKYWSKKKENRVKVFNYLKDAVEFKETNTIDHNDIRNWSFQMKTLAIARTPEFTNYLKGFLDDESTCLLQDWSKFKNENRDSFKPEIRIVRVCDIAFVALLRSYDQIRFEIDWNRKHVAPMLKFGHEVFNAQFTDSFEGDLRKFDNGMYLYECYFKLNTDFKEMVKNKTSN